MSVKPVELGKVPGGTLYSEPAPTSPAGRKYTLVDDNGHAREVLRDEARDLIALIKPSRNPDKTVARYAANLKEALSGLNLGEKGLRELDKKMAVPEGYNPGPQGDPGFKSVGAPAKRFAPVGDEGKFPTPKGDVGLRTSKEKVTRTGGLGIPKDADPKQTRYNDVWNQLGKVMLDPKKQDLDPLFRKLNEAKTEAGISDDQFKYKAFSMIRQWMLSIGNSIQNARVQEASDEYNQGPIVRPSGGDAYSGVAKLKSAIFALDPTGHYTEADIRDTASPGWQRVIVALNQEFEKKLDEFPKLKRTKNPEHDRSRAEILYAEAMSLASYAPDRKEAMTRAKEVYDETLARIGG